MLACSWCELLIGATSFYQGNLNNTGHNRVTRQPMEIPSWWIIIAQALCLERSGTEASSVHHLSFHISLLLFQRPVEALVTTTYPLSRPPSGFFGSASGFKYLGDLGSHFAALCHGEKSCRAAFGLRSDSSGGHTFSHDWPAVSRSLSGIFYCFPWVFLLSSAAAGWLMWPDDDFNIRSWQAYPTHTLPAFNEDLHLLLICSQQAQNRANNVGHKDNINADSLCNIQMCLKFLFHFGDP